MRQKSENIARDQYARRYAALLAVDALIQYRAKGIETVIVVEAEDNALWDDVVEVQASVAGERRHQVKRQQTPLAEDEFAKYVIAAANGNSKVAYHFAFPVLLDVTDTGALRVLRGLCERAQQAGANQRKVLENLRDAERVWVDSIAKWTDYDDDHVFALLQRMHINVIGFEEDIDRVALRLLEPNFAHATEEAWTRVRDFVSDKDGVAEIHPEALWKLMPQPAADEIDMLYWSFIEEVEEKFCLRHWEWLTDHVVRNLVPLEFYDGGFSFARSQLGTVWPDRYPELNDQFRNLADRTCEYLNHFDTRCYFVGDWAREDKRFKQVFPNPRYHEEADAADAWRLGNQYRFRNVVVALNELFRAIRKCLRPTYRLRDGQLGIHDEMGVTNELQPTIYYPEEYADLGEGDVARTDDADPAG